MHQVGISEGIQVGTVSLQEVNHGALFVTNSLVQEIFPHSLRLHTSSGLQQNFHHFPCGNLQGLGLQPHGGESSRLHSFD